MEELVIYVIAQDYSSVAEIQEFVSQHKLTIPVLLGSDMTQENYRITSFPTYYFLAEDGRIQGHTVGYTTEMGLRMRLL